LVRVFDPQSEDTAELARQEPIKKRGSGTADVKEACR
jgi:hypothetical protein